MNIKSRFNQLKKSGVYIHHCDGNIVYIGQTTKGKWGTFSERLRREFQEKASRNSSLYQLLLSQTNTVKTLLLDFDYIEKMFECETIQLSKERKALILEQILIALHLPEGNNK